MLFFCIFQSVPVRLLTVSTNECCIIAFTVIQKKQTSQGVITQSNQSHNTFVYKQKKSAREHGAGHQLKGKRLSLFYSFLVQTLTSLNTKTWIGRLHVILFFRYNVYSDMFLTSFAWINISPLNEKEPCLNAIDSIISVSSGIVNFMKFALAWIYLLSRFLMTNSKFVKFVNFLFKLMFL